MSAQRNWFLWPLVTIPLASLPVLVNAVVWTILRRCLPGFPLFRAEDLAYYSLIVIGAFTLRRRGEPTFGAVIVIMTVLCASPLRSSRHDAIIPEADGPSQPGFQAVQVADAWEPPPPQPSGVFEGESQTVQMALILAVLVTVLVAVLARQLSTGPTPPTRLLWKLWGIRLLLAALPLLMNMHWRLSGVRCQILTIDGLNFFSIALAAQGIIDIAVSRLPGSHWTRVASSVGLMISAVLASMVLGLWYFSELPLQQEI